MQIMRNRTVSRTMLFAILMVLLQLTLFTSFVSADTTETNAVEIINIDEELSYEREVSKGESVTYYWTLINVYEGNRTVNVTISFVNTNSDWAASLEPESPINLTHKWDAKTVSLTVTAPSDKTEGSTEVTLEFTFEMEGDIIQPIEKRNSFTSLTPIAKPEEEKKVLDLFENPLPAPLDNEFGVFFLTVLIWLFFSIILIFVMDPCVKAFTKKTKTEIDDIVLRIIKTPLLVLVFFYGLVSSLIILENHIPSSILDIINAIYGVVVVLILFYVVYKLFKDILVYYGKVIAKKTASNIDDVIVPIVEKLGVVIIALVALGYVLGYLNIDMTMFVAGGVVVSMVIAFAAQETLSNLFSGIFILTDRPFIQGDTIILPDGDWYEVRNIGLRSTRLFRFKDASLITIPNNKIATEKIINYSNPYDKVRIRRTIGVAYGTDAEKTKKIIHEVIAANPHVITDDEDLKPVVRFDELGESSIDFFIQVHVDDRSNKLGVIDYLNTEIYKRFNEEGIEIPFPQRVIHIKKEEG